MASLIKKYTREELNYIARWIWYGSFPGKGMDVKFADANQVDVNMRYADFDIPSHRWVPIGDGLEIKINSNVKGGLPGRFFVRRHEYNQVEIVGRLNEKNADEMILEVNGQRVIAQRVTIQNEAGKDVRRWGVHMANAWNPSGCFFITAARLDTLVKRLRFHEHKLVK